MVKWVFSVLQNAWKCSVYAIKQKSDIKFSLNFVIDGTKTGRKKREMKCYEAGNL